MGTLATATRSKAYRWRSPTPAPTPRRLHPRRLLPPPPPRAPSRGAHRSPPRCPSAIRAWQRTAVRYWSPWGRCKTPGCPGWRATTPLCFSPPLPNIPCPRHRCVVLTLPPHPTTPNLRRLCVQEAQAENTVSGQRPVSTHLYCPTTSVSSPWVC